MWSRDSLHGERGQLPTPWLNPTHGFAFLKKLVLLFALNSSCLSAILFEVILLRMMVPWPLLDPVLVNLLCLLYLHVATSYLYPAGPWQPVLAFHLGDTLGAPHPDKAWDCPKQWWWRLGDSCLSFGVSCRSFSSDRYYSRKGAEIRVCHKDSFPSSQTTIRPKISHSKAVGTVMGAGVMKVTSETQQEQRSYHTLFCQYLESRICVLFRIEYLAPAQYLVHSRYSINICCI